MRLNRLAEPAYDGLRDSAPAIHDDRRASARIPLMRTELPAIPPAASAILLKEISAVAVAVPVAHVDHELVAAGLVAHRVAAPGVCVRLPPAVFLLRFLA